MKNYLISHIKRRVETFIKQAQESFSETTYAQILALLASHKDEEELKASMRNDTFRNLLSSLVAWTKNKDLKKANVKVHLDIKNFMAEMEDISSNPEIDETLADLVETDFYADFEEILLNSLEHAEAVGELDTESEKTHEEIIDLTEISLTSSEEELSPDDSSEGKTLEAVAKKAGVSYGTAFQSDAIQRKGTEEQKQAVSNGEASIKKVYTQIQKAERHENLKTANFPEGKYRVIYIY